MLTFLISQGLSDARIQLIYGHESKKSLEVYQHLSRETVEEDYQEAVQSLGLWRAALLSLNQLLGSDRNGDDSLVRASEQWPRNSH